MKAERPAPKARLASSGRAAAAFVNASSASPKRPSTIAVVPARPRAVASCAAHGSATERVAASVRIVRNFESEIVTDCFAGARKAPDVRVRMPPLLPRWPTLSFGCADKVSPTEADSAGASAIDSELWEVEMDIKRSGSQPSSKGPAEYFTGTVRIDPLFQSADPARVVGASVTFEPGARTAWHTHPLGQTLVVLAG